MSFLEQKTILITGGGRGIGREIALMSREIGAKVGVIDINENFLKDLPKDIFTFHGDVSSSNDLNNFYTKAKEKFSKIDYLVANAVHIMSDEKDVGEVLFDHLLAVNFKGMYQSMKLAIPHMEECGAIVSLGAASAFDDITTTKDSWAEYTSIKLAIKYLTRSLAAHNDKKVRVNMISPGLVESPRVDTLLDRMNLSKQQFSECIPEGRLVSMSEIAKVILFLLSPDAAYINGVDLPVDGGWAVAGSNMPT